MKTINDILTEEEIREYEISWFNFKGKYKLNTERNVHSGIPVISEVYQFKNFPIFRAHVFGKRLRRFDPYHQASEGIQPFWHAQHYFMVGEQMYSACSRLIIGRECDKQIAKDVPCEFNWKKPIFFDDNISIELIREELGKIGVYEKQAGYFTLYSDKTYRVLSRMSALSFWKLRTYILDIQKIKGGDKQAIDDLIRKIEAQAIKHRKLLKPRTTLKITREELIQALKEGKIPEEQLHDFFSLWDKP